MRKRSVATNFASNLVYQAMSVVVPLVTTPYVSRVIRPEGLGIYSYSLSVATLYSLFISLGINMYGMRSVASCSSPAARSKVFWELALIRVVMAALVCTVYIGMAFRDERYGEALLLQIPLLLAVAIDVSWFFQGQEDFQAVAIRDSVIKIVAMVSIFVFVRSAADLPLYILIGSGATLGGNAVLLLSCRGSVTRVPFRELVPLTHLVGVLQFFVPIVAVQLYSQIDKVMLGTLLPSTTELGYFEQARKISNMLVIVCTAINGVNYPRVANLLAAGDRDGIRNAHVETIRVVWLILLPVVVLLPFMAGNFGDWFYGEGYESVRVLLQLSAPMIFFSTLGNFCAMLYLNPMGLQNYGTAAYIAAAVANVLMNWLLIPRLLATGAIVASVVAELISCTLQFVLYHRSTYYVGTFRYGGIYLLGSVVALGAVLAVGVLPLSGPITTFMQLLLGGALYVAFLWTMHEPVARRFQQVVSRRLRLPGRGGLDA